MSSVVASSSDPGGLVDRLVGVCIALFVGAIAIYAAVRLIEAIWSTLLLILGGVLLVACLVGAWRLRSRNW